MIFFSLSKSKLPGYILTVTVACGILTARFFERAMANPDGKAARIIGRAAITLAVLCFVVAIAAIILSTRMGFAGQAARDFPLPTRRNWAVISSRRSFCCSVFAVLGLLVHFRRDAGLCFAVFAIFPLLLFTLNFGVIEIVFQRQVRPPIVAKNSRRCRPKPSWLFWNVFPVDCRFI